MFDIVQKSKLTDHWFKLASDLGMEKDSSIHIYEMLITLYSDSRRTYHNLSHIYNLFESISNKAQHSKSLDLAIWFHDVYYSGSPGHDERLSAELLLSIKPLVPTQNHTLITDAVNMIMLTAKHEYSGIYSEITEFLDADLGILATSSETYLKYSDDIIQEYQNLYKFLSKEMVQKGRLDFLKTFSKREKIFIVKSGWEPKARENIANEIARLEKSLNV